MIARISGKNISIQNVPGPEGVRGRNSDNHMIAKKRGWQPTARLEDGMRKTYRWIEEQVKNQETSNQ